ncbi:hypothetical protein XELAEV_18015374mg [Xenopus laevis]|uniref:Uncharacterized protein n=1 Tax=Xenopus laevis TaxID=8355 RepID=A0A974DHW5_XENLA|nr:hypothetical protein XELAEV_18015374mg [Xenopus laevis]
MSMNQLLKYNEWILFFCLCLKPYAISFLMLMFCKMHAKYYTNCFLYSRRSTRLEKCMKNAIFCTSILLVHWYYSAFIYKYHSKYNQSI